MPFGKHKGTPLDALRADYLTWLAGWLDQRPRQFVDLRLAVGAELERRRSRLQRLHDAWRAGDDGLPVGQPCTAYGLELNRYHAGQLFLSMANRELYVTLDTPLDSPVHEAWRLWCAERGWEHKVSEEPNPWLNHRENGTS